MTLAATKLRVRVLPALLPVNGVNPELRANDTHIQYRLVGDENWIDIIALSALVGDTGANVELRSNGSYIQWRVAGSGAAWTDLVLLSTLKGDQGEPGIAATVDVGTVTTLDPGESATVTNSGTAAAAILDFAIPRGAAGADGTNGADGADGFGVPVPASGDAGKIPYVNAEEDGYELLAAPVGDGAAVADMAALKALDTSKRSTAFVKDISRSGWFTFLSGDYSSEVTADSAEAFYAAASDTASTSGAWVRDNRERVKLRQFGAVGDGTTDDTTAITLAFAFGAPLDGEGRTYAVSGNVTMPAELDLFNTGFKQLTPTASTSVRTLFSDGVDNLRLVRVWVDRNGDGTSGGLDTASGIWIQGGSGHLLEDVEVFGDDCGAGIRMQGASGFSLVRPYAHDINYALAEDPEDDRVQGIIISGCSDFTVINHRAENLGGTIGGGAANVIYSRGLAIGGGSHSFEVFGGVSRFVDQGVDVSGSGGCYNYSFFGTRAEDCQTWGHKAANFNRFASYHGCKALRCGSASFVVSGPSSDGAPVSTLPRHIDYIGCLSLDVGYENTERGTSQPAGFLILPNDFNTDFPRGIRFAHCAAIDNQTVKTQYHGFRNEVSFGGVPSNRIESCNASGFAVGGGVSSGFPMPVALVYHGTTQSIPNNANTAVVFNAELDDTTPMHSTTSDTDNVLIYESGYYAIDASVGWTGNATGQRQLLIRVNGVAPVNGRKVDGTASANNWSQQLTGIYKLSAGEVVDVAVYQNSGGALNLYANDTWLSVAKVSERH